MIQFNRRFAALGAALVVLSSSVFGQAASPFMRMQKPSATQEVLQTKARKYSSADGKGPDIWLVGVAHVGQAGYYREIQKLLDTQSTVLYEGVTKKGVDPAAPAKDPKADPRQKSTYQLLSDSLQLQFQLFGIDYKRPSFINADLSWEELTAIESKYPKAKTGMSLATIGNLLNADSEQGQQLASGLAMIKDDPSSVEAMHLIMIEALSNPKAIDQTLSPELNELLIKTRNAKVLSSLKTELQTKPGQKSIAIFFGAGHMADMEKHLMSDFGYKPGEEQWFSAIKGDTKNVTSSTGQTILSMMRAALLKKKDGG